MTVKRMFGVCLVAVLAVSGCKKDENKPAEPAAAPPATAAQPATPAQPAAPPTTETNATQTPPTANPEPAAPTAGSSADTERALAALDQSAGMLSGNLGRAFGNLSFGKRMGGAEMAAASPPDGQPNLGAGGRTDPEPAPFSRVMFQFDLGALRASQLWPLVETAIQMAKAQDDSGGKTACIFDLLPKFNSVYMDVALGADGEASSVLISAKSTATTDEVVNCVKANLDEGQTWQEVQISGKPGYTVAGGDDDHPPFILEPAPGNWVMGYQAPVEALAAAGTDPEADPAFVALAAPLGASGIRIAMVATPAFGALANEMGEVPQVVACMQPAFQRVTALSAGAKLSPDLTVTLAVQNASPVEAAETQQCLTAIWEMMKPYVLQQVFDPQTSAAIQQMLGMTPQQLLDRLQIQAEGPFAKATVSIPGEALAQVLQMVGAMMQMGQ